VPWSRIGNFFATIGPLGTLAALRSAHEGLACDVAMMHTKLDAVSTAPSSEPLEKERLEIERLKLVQAAIDSERENKRLEGIKQIIYVHAQEAPDGTQAFAEPGRGRGWVLGAWTILEQNVAWSKMYRFQRFLIEANMGNDPVASDLGEAKATLRAIASSLKPDDLT
jgi:hypothetical protein